ncbi:hypothetical protein Tsubulata_031796 [Turnera subulata]|uniref:Uncharacterized protein n=1 Tax=Turnera subulata TaxID=218843 RepID=A0A9Q0FF60_9ROSI|nr:hypothetical protein Tsubulata_031796 [Turnera subulata]
MALSIRFILYLIYIWFVSLLFFTILAISLLLFWLVNCKPMKSCQLCWGCRQSHTSQGSFSKAQVFQCHVCCNVIYRCLYNVVG